MGALLLAAGCGSSAAPSEMDGAQCVDPSLEYDGQRPRPNPDATPGPAPGTALCEEDEACSIASLEAGGGASALISGTTCVIRTDGSTRCAGLGSPPFDGEAVRTLAVSASHGCAVTDGGAVRCWGIWQLGQLGDPAIFEETRPPLLHEAVAVEGLGGVIDLAVAPNRSCALLEDGTVWCWGDAEGGHLGVGDAPDRCDDRPCAKSPQRVEGLTGVLQIGVGQGHACAVLEDRTVRCWGQNDVGQIGDGTRDDRPQPVEVPGLTGVRSVAVGASASCAVLDDGAVRCWGYIGTGRPDGGTGDENPCCQEAHRSRVCMGDHEEIADLPTVVAVGVGKEHACALAEDGRIFCWGGNRAGQLGTGDFEPRSSPTEVPGPPADFLAVARLHTCAATAEGSVRCWGDDESGQLGIGQGEPFFCESVLGHDYPCAPEPMDAWELETLM